MAEVHVRTLALLLLPLTVACTRPDDDGDDTDLPSDDGPVRIGLITDSHVIASDYVCCESPGLDTESITRTNNRLRAARDNLDAVTPPVERLFVVGDVFHQNYKWGEDLDAYLSNETAAGNARDLYAGFGMPVSFTWGNHDYEVPEISRSFSHELFRTLFGMEPYYAVEIGGWRVLVLNSQLGPTWDELSPLFETGNGSFGAEQLAWIEAELKKGDPTILLSHHHPFVLPRGENADGELDAAADLQELVSRYSDVVRAVFFGHIHRWIDMTGQFDGFGEVPTFTVGAVRYDADNFWVLDLERDGSAFTIVDEDKAGWATVYGYATTYEEDGTATVDMVTPIEAE